ncbi:MAG TPA: hypothetical protein PLQ57_10100 [Saprospiraceae bacterium]|nr:hypothetical protein [Saprospiraceae bacterium]
MLKVQFRNTKMRYCGQIVKDYRHLARILTDVYELMSRFPLAGFCREEAHKYFPRRSS